VTPDLDLDAIEARAESATRGPWTTDVEIDGYRAGLRTVVRGPFGKRILTVGQIRLHESGDAEANVAFTAAARDDVPALIAEVRRLRAENAGLRVAVLLLTDGVAEARADVDDDDDECGGD
jgi:hypothetical protein